MADRWGNRWGPGVLRFMGSQRVGQDWATELNAVKTRAERQRKSLRFGIAVSEMWWPQPDNINRKFPKSRIASSKRGTNWLNFFLNFIVPLFPLRGHTIPSFYWFSFKYYQVPSVSWWFKSPRPPPPTINCVRHKWHILAETYHRLWNLKTWNPVVSTWFTRNGTPGKNCYLSKPHSPQ